MIRIRDVIVGVLLGAVSTAVSHAIGLGMSEGLRELLVPSGGSASDTLQAMIWYLWPATSGFFICCFFALILHHLRLHPIKVLAGAFIAVGLLVIAIPVATIIVDPRIGDDLIGWYLLLMLLASSVFWTLMRCREHDQQEPRGFAVIPITRQ